MTYTPGPWKVCDDKRRIRATSEFWDGAVIADVKDTNWRYRDDGTVEANARLIAAAPALLEALEKLLTEYMGRVGSRYEESAEFREEVEKLRPNAFKARDAARDAIALARGEEVTA